MTGFQSVLGLLHHFVLARGIRVKQLPISENGPLIFASNVLKACVALMAAAPAL